MRAFEFLLEGYPDTIAAFSQQNDPSLVKTTVDQYKQLVNKNQVQGNERNIDWWRKQGWDNFYNFVQQKSQERTKTQEKRKKIPGKSITLQEDDNWLIVIPLDKDASCFHGKNSDWCTTKIHQPYFENYFYDNKITLIYCLSKKTGGMWAIAAHKDVDKIELFDQNDKTINEATFKAQTGLDARQLANKTHATHGQEIEASREYFQDAIEELWSKVPRIKDKDPEIERLLAYTKSFLYTYMYMSRLNGIIGPQDYPEALQILAFTPNEVDVEELDVYGYSYGRPIKFIKNLTPRALTHALKNDQNGEVFRQIKDPTPEIQLAAVKQNGNLIYYIKDPSPEVQSAAVKQDPTTIRFIKNPSPALQLYSVQNGSMLRNIEKPTFEVQWAALKRNPDNITFIDDPSEDMQLYAVQNNPDLLFYLLKHSTTTDKVKLTAIEQNPNVIRWIEKPTVEQQIAAITKNHYVFKLIKDLDPKAAKVYKQITGEDPFYG